MIMRFAFSSDYRQISPYWAQRKSEKRMRKGRVLAAIIVVFVVAVAVGGYLNGGEQTMSRVEVPLEPKAPERPVEDYSE